MSDLHELRLRVAELYRLRDEYAGRSERNALARYVDSLLARLEAEIAAAAPDREMPAEAKAERSAPVKP